MSKGNPPKSVYVVYTADETDLRANLPVIRALAERHELLYVRECGLKEETTRGELVRDIIRAMNVAPNIADLIGPNVLIVKSSCIIKTLDKMNIVASGFFGAKPELMYKRPAPSGIKMRIARLCTKCEMVISEKVSMVTKKHADIVHSQYSLDHEADSSYIGKNLNVNISDRCPHGC